MKELELKATSEDDIRAGDETLGTIFAEDLTLGVGGGAALAGRTAATPQEGGDLAAAQAMATLSFVHNGQLKIDGATNPPPVCSGFGRGGAHLQDTNQKPPANEGKHCCKPSDQPRDAAQREECSDLDEKSLTTFCR